MSLLEEEAHVVQDWGPWSTAILRLQGLVPGLLPPDTEANPLWQDFRRSAVQLLALCPLPLPPALDWLPGIGGEKGGECSGKALFNPIFLFFFFSFFTHSLTHSLIHGQDREIVGSALVSEESSLDSNKRKRGRGGRRQRQMKIKLCFASRKINNSDAV